MINAEIIRQYIKNKDPISEEDLIKIIYYDSPASLTKTEIKSVLNQLVKEDKILLTHENGIATYNYIK
ncbi:hypothetical protein [Methanosphaera sp. WGK6]|uniref:hypothetical protein n=1 Tax=Methanosphaera sp. WGK6 TaxID=1561964 RepID=UPI00084C2EF8|nr:hypothetical protein [Methanosphaera sp. WGK6]OED29918.1 hypothetical protein NL43_05785 [Methanosphaera sp. WGK6]